MSAVAWPTPYPEDAYDWEDGIAFSCEEEEALYFRSQPPPRLLAEPMATSMPGCIRLKRKRKQRHISRQFPISFSAHL